VKKTKLELTWPGKEERPELEPRILIEHPDRSHYAAARGDGDLFDNLLIKGDNLLALKALETDYAGKVKCVFIDPPYNTGSAFEHYDDGVEHSLWLSLMRDRLEVIRRLLSEDGSLWVTLDDNEAHYFKVMCDEVFGRNNFVADVIWEKKFSPQNDAKWLSDNHDHVIVFAKQKANWRPNLLPKSEKQAANLRNADDDPRGPWHSGDYTCAKNKKERPNLYYPIYQPNLQREVWPSETRVWAFDRSATERNVADNLLYWGSDGLNERPRLKKFPEAGRGGLVSVTVWLNSEVGNNQEARKESLVFNRENPFSTPKPERLIERVLLLATNPGDLVLDSFAGSGTTGAVAHKMGRRWIMVEIGDHADTHIVPRLTKVVDGEDAGGVTKAVGWQGGGGFRYYTLAPSLLERDRWGNWVIAREYNAAMLAEAMCKHLGFTYAPAQDEAEYWRHGQSSETDFLYVTTQSLTHDALKLLSDEVGPDRTLMICARAFSGSVDAFPNLTCRKIPSTILTKCEWGRDDYSLNVAALPTAANDPPDSGPRFAAAGERVDG
jgi:adenine-specific DNA-methyltransferase